MKKYIVCLLFAVFLMLTILPRNAVSAESVISGTLEENLTWEFRDGTLTISGNGYMGSYSISENPPWFHLRDGIHTIVVSEGVMSLGGWVFKEHSNVTKVILPSTLKYISARVFQDCFNLTEINIPDKITEIAEYAFRNCWGLKSFTVPNSVPRLGQGVFEGCKGLESVTLSEKLTYLVPSLFQNCTNLTSITIPESIEDIGWYAFQGCTNLKTVEIKGNIKSINYNAFEDCESLESLELPASLEWMGDRVFSSCRSLNSIRFNGDIPQFGDMVFDVGWRSEGVLCNVYYPVNNKTWTQEKMDKAIAWYTNSVQFVPYGTPECDHDVVIVPGKESTCTEEGLTEKQYCSKCNKVLKEQSVIECLGHEFEVTTIVSTCTEFGYDLHKCKRCQLEERHNEVPVLEHTFSEWETVKEPTVQESGVQVRSCTRCQSKQERLLDRLSAPTEPPTESPTEPPTESPTETPTESPTEPTYMESKPTEPDFSQPEVVVSLEHREVGILMGLILVVTVAVIFIVRWHTKKRM